MSYNLQLTGSYKTTFGGSEYITKHKNIVWQGTFPGFDGPPPLVGGKVINTNNDPNVGGIHGIDVSDPTNPTRVAFLKAPKDVSYACVDATTLYNGKDLIASGNTPSYCWSLVPDISKNLNPKDSNGDIKGFGGLSMWDVSDINSPSQLPTLFNNRDDSSKKRRELLLDAGANKTDIVTGQVFSETEHPYGEYVFQSDDDGAIRSTFFKRKNKDYIMITYISGDSGLSIYDITKPQKPKHIVDYSPIMNYYLQIEDVCSSINNSYKHKYYEKLKPDKNSHDFAAVKLLSNRYWDRINSKQLPPSSGLTPNGTKYPVSFHAHYIPEKDAILVSSSLDFFYLDVSNLKKPIIVSNLSNRTQFPTLKTPSGNFDMVQHYTRQGKELIAGYHNSDSKMVNNKLMVAIASDHYYTNSTGNEISTSVSMWDYTDPSAPKLKSFIEESAGEAHTVHLHTFNNKFILLEGNLIEGAKMYDLTNITAPSLVANYTGTFSLGIPGAPPISIPNAFSGFSPIDFLNYPEPFKTFSFITNLPGAQPPLGIIPYQFAPLAFDAIFDETKGELYLQFRTGVTVVVKITVQ